MIDQDQADNRVLLGHFGAIWGVAGVCLILSFAIYRLSVITIESFQFTFLWYHWAILIGNILFMAHSEGYKGFQKGFSPRVAARARYLKFNPRLHLIIFAPLFCMGYFHATRRRLITTYLMTLGIISLIILFNQISQPWRGILDAGVVTGLCWGVVSVIVYFIRAMTDGDFEFSAELPVVSAEQ